LFLIKALEKNHNRVILVEVDKNIIAITASAIEPLKEVSIVFNPIGQ
jgi:16S rRNA A1518/A1519 N6-dimethyltransferase RsmA/KsgA/DIM1 with predicted DNA glycosylase/AP lyase activity